MSVNRPGKKQAANSGRDSCPQLTASGVVKKTARGQSPGSFWVKS